MKTLIRNIMAFTLLIGLAACQKEGDKIYLESLTQGELIASESSVVLSNENRAKQVLSLAWSAHQPGVSDPTVTAPPLVINQLQISLDESFNSYVVSSEPSLSKSYTGGELNAVAKNLQAIADVANTFYFRVASTTGSNIAPIYSNSQSVQVTPYTIDMSIGFVLDASKEDTGVTLASSNEDGIYTGFMGATSWQNYYLLEGDGTIWGNDGVSGEEFVISSESSQWNCWFPGQGGCYFVEVNTPKKEWSALYMPELTLTGDLSGTMNFDRPNRLWKYNFQATEHGTINIEVSGMGKLYNRTTATDDEAAINTPVAFGGNSSQLSFDATPTTITIPVEVTGEVTLIINLTNPNNWSAHVELAGEEPVALPQRLYLAGIDDKILGDWLFESKIELHDEEKTSYVGVVNAASNWGYNLFTEAGNWDEKYTLVEGDGYAGSMELNGTGGNLPAPTDGLYLYQASTQALTYSLTAIGTEIYYSGLNDSWDLHDMQVTETAGVFQAVITIEKASEWGFQLILDSAWSHKYGGSNGTLYYEGQNFTEDATLSPGNYTFTVNLIEGSYTLVP